MKKNILILSSMVVASILFTGCATILSGDNQNVNLQSRKEQVVSINGQKFVSPGVVSIERKNKDAILKVQDGDCKKEVLLRKEINPVFYVNILSGGIFGSTTDYSSDAMWQYDQSNIYVDCDN